jgi:hypothetical protein
VTHPACPFCQIQEEKKKKKSIILHLHELLLGLGEPSFGTHYTTVLVKQIYIYIYINLGTSSMNETGLTFPENFQT